MAPKLTFHLNGTSNLSTSSDNNLDIKIRLLKTLEEKEILYSHIYAPTKTSIKVIFPTETEIDKVMNASEYFKMHNLNPKMNLKSKNNRTVFCKNLDPAILSTYNGEEIKNMILQQGWNIKKVYIIKN